LEEKHSTWGHCGKRLDRCLANSDWRLHFPNAVVELLQPHKFDHNPLLLAQEIAHFMHKRKTGKKGYILFKINFEKAYDNVNWDFMRLTLIKFGFPPPIVTLIMNCTTTTSLSFKWNGEKLESFALNRGLR